MARLGENRYGKSRVRLSRITRREVTGIPVFGVTPRLIKHMHPCEMMVADCLCEVEGELIKLPMPATALEAIDLVIVAAATGMITPEAAERLVGLFNVRARVAELPILQERIARIEALLTGRSEVAIDTLAEELAQ